MPGYRPDERNIRNCTATKETIRNMVRYITDDERIARWTKAPLDMVQMARRNIRHRERWVDRQDFHRESVPEGDSGEGEVWTRRMHARKSDALMRAALDKVK